MHPLPQFVVKFAQLCLTSFTHRLSQHGKLPFSGFAADMRKTEEIESLRFSPSSFGSVLRRKTTEFNQARFIGV
jgi:hypothetical protein